MKVLVTGAYGMLGRDFCYLLKNQGFSIWEWDLPDHDITNVNKIISDIVDLKPDIVCHLAAYTDVDNAEKETGRAFMVNVQGTWAIANACFQIDIPLLFISSDYVFDGTKNTPYDENDQANPINYYGKTKYLGEEVIRSHLNKYFIVRTSWLFGKHGRNFVRTIIDLSCKRDKISVVNDQIGSPTYTKDLSEALLNLLTSTHYGIYHITNSGACSWYEFANEIKRLAQLSVEILPISSADLNRLAKRPAYSVLDNKRYKKQFGKTLRPWQEALKTFLSELNYG
ncbi:MAG: dTDP-4-dehydrorhamnose reductase [candidate division WOR-3 bacterium]|nr:dTDP-4-dehydrorhamnose reductase [candidate division WOR-3 bacterium]MCX7757111.1 dTDP-4-dehydrorhamnose reductase [candidate division WOR-3 bacterium]